MLHVSSNAVSLVRMRSILRVRNGYRFLRARTELLTSISILLGLPEQEDCKCFITVERPIVGSNDLG